MSDIQKSIQNALDDLYKTMPDDNATKDEPSASVERTPIFFSDEEKIALGLKKSGTPGGKQNHSNSETVQEDLNIPCKIKEGKMVIFFPEDFDFTGLSKVDDSYYLVLDAPDMRLSCIQALKVYRK